MSDKENLNEEETGCDEKQTGAVDVGNETTNLDSTTSASQHTSEIADYDCQHFAAEDTEITPDDIVTVQALSHEPLRESSNENSGYRVLVEFPSDLQNVNPFPHIYAGSTDITSSHKCLQVSNYSDHCSDLQERKNQEDKLIEVVDIQALNREAPDVVPIAGISRETERKRKKVPISLMPHKRQKEAESLCKSSIPLPHQTEDIANDIFKDSDSGEFADIEDNVKESSSSDNNETISKEKDLDSNIQGRSIKALDKSESVKINLSSPSNIDASQNSKLVDKFFEESRFASSLKDEKIPALKLSNEAKQKFELSMETILEVPESGSDEQINQPMVSKTNPLKMKTAVGNRKDKCNVCNVRLGLCAIRCRCGGYYCAKHRYDREHNCSFDYKSMGAEEIRKNNPRIVAEKIRKL